MKNLLFNGNAKKYILAIDQGTTSSRAILIDRQGIPLFFAQRAVNCSFPQSGWVEADALAIFVSVIDVINEVLIKANISINDVDSIGITNQRETTVIWDKKTGLPIYNAIVWQSRQTEDICASLNDKKEFIHKKTGLLINPYFSASKIRFILDKIPGAQERAEKGELLFGTIDSWIIYKLTKGKVHATDVTNASRTLLFNIFDLKWDKELCSLFNVPLIMLPKVNPSSFDYGPALYFSKDVHITGVAGDQQAALFGQACFEKGDTKNTYGTGCFMLMNTGKDIVLSNKGLLSVIAWQIKDEVVYALEGSVFIGGALINWLKDSLKMMNNYLEVDHIGEIVSSSNGIYVVPAFVGLGTPYWDNEARGAIFGLTRGSTREELIRASVESVAYQCKDVFEVMKKESGLSIKTLKVDGGLSKSSFMLQFQSDILRCQIKVPTYFETTALGACYLAGLESGFFKSIDEIKKIHTYQKTYKPLMKPLEVRNKYKKWKIAVKATMVFK